MQCSFMGGHVERTSCQNHQVGLLDPLQDHCFCNCCCCLDTKLCPTLCDPMDCSSSTTDDCAWLEQSTCSGATHELVRDECSFSHWPAENFHPRTSSATQGYHMSLFLPLLISKLLLGSIPRQKWQGPYKSLPWLVLVHCGLPYISSAYCHKHHSVIVISWISFCILEHSQNKRDVDFLSLNI